MLRSNSKSLGNHVNYVDLHIFCLYLLIYLLLFHFARGRFVVDLVGR